MSGARQEALDAIESDDDSRLADVVEKSSKKLLEGTRRKVAERIVCAYLAVIVIISFYLVYRGIYGKEDVTADFFELLKIGVTPILTLVLGYYFGSSKS